MPETIQRQSRTKLYVVLVVLFGALAAVGAVFYRWRTSAPYLPRKSGDLSGFTSVQTNIKPWPTGASLDDVSKAWQGIGFQLAEKIDKRVAKLPEEKTIGPLLEKVKFR